MTTEEDPAVASAFGLGALRGWWAARTAASASGQAAGAVPVSYPDADDNTPPPAVGTAFVRWLDSRLRSSLGIIDFTSHADCVLRIRLTRAEQSVTLSDGTEIRPGDPLVELHFWNEHIPLIGRRGCTVAWADMFKKRMRFSMEALATYIASHGELAAYKAVHGRVAFSLRQGSKQLDRLARHYGFDIAESRPPRRLETWLRDAGDNILLWMILWAFNPGSLKYSRFVRPRRDLWMSLDMLRRRYGARSDRRAVP